jgi:hypothetical protein
MSWHQALEGNEDTFVTDFYRRNARIWEDPTFAASDKVRGV